MPGGAAVRDVVSRQPGRDDVDMALSLSKRWTRGLEKRLE